MSGMAATAAIKSGAAFNARGEECGGGGINDGGAGNRNNNVVTTRVPTTVAAMAMKTTIN